jgi:putative heme-binding domain-containing protein
MRRSVLIVVLCAGAAFAQESRPAATLERQLLAEDAATLARDVLSKGDPLRGAILFYQPYLTCTKCHATGDESLQALGPDLSKPEKKIEPAHIVESILDPSRVIRKGFEAVTVVTKDGKTVNGILGEETGANIVVRDAGLEGQQISIAKDNIDELTRLKTSLMPAGLANLLADRQQFLDLAAYVAEISAKGPARALELKPPPALYVLPPIPEYEGHLDHCGLIAAWDQESYQRGERIYRRVCANCHGTHDQVGSLPASLRFASGRFKNGSDPLSIYQTLTRGFGMMVPQSWMMPVQKYDVIHYIREAYLKSHNPSQYARVDDAYLKRLPTGDTRGPSPSNLELWIAMDYGPSLINTYEIGNDGRNFAFKGIAVRLDPGSGGVSRGRDWMVFDHDTLRMAGAWSARPNSKEPPFIDWQGIQFDGQHQVHPRVVGDVAVANPIDPGWANPATDRFDDPRPKARDGRPYGPLPRDWAHYRGLYAFGHQTVISYTVGKTPVLELPVRASTTGGSPSPIFARMFHIGPRPRKLKLLVATHREHEARLETKRMTIGGSAQEVALLRGAASAQRQREEAKPSTITAGLIPAIRGAVWGVGAGGHLLLSIPAGDQPLDLTLWHSAAGDPSAAADLALTAQESFGAPLQLEQLLHGGPRRWPEVLKTRPATLASTGTQNNEPFAIDVLAHPVDNPWLAQMRFTGLDFFDDGDSLAVCTWDGDVWLVRGLKTLNGAADSENNKPVGSPELSWQRIASGLFQPLGLKIVGGIIHLTCRDQLVILHDLNGDGETDFYENFNNDHQVTEHFHEFAMGLQTDDDGNFYYAKSARHALPALVPHHGTLLRVSRDGSQTEILANGFRAANGVCLNQDGSFIVTDQEGHWNPKNRINRVTPGGFYGNMFGYHDRTDPSDAAMEQPVCWITNRFDRSPAELLWVTSDRWGPLQGSLLNLSYGFGKIYVVPHENSGGQWQGGMSELPLPAFPTGIMRGRFHPQDGQLYVCGMFAWAGSATQPGGLYRVRYTGRPVYVPVKLHARRGGLDITFSGPLEQTAAEDAKRFAVTIWGLKRTANYGSEHYDERPLAVQSASLADDGSTVRLELPGIRSTWCMEIKYSLRNVDGQPVSGMIHNTVHRLAE